MAVTEDRAAQEALLAVTATASTAHALIEKHLDDPNYVKEPQPDQFATMGQCAHEGAVASFQIGSRTATHHCPECGESWEEQAEAPTPECEHEQVLTAPDGARMCRACGEDPWQS
jgi:hypothetical protein